MTSITNIVTIIAAVVAIVTTPIFLWIAIQNMDDKKVNKLRDHIKVTKWFISLIVGCLFFAYSFINLLLSDDPISKFNIAIMVLSGSMFFTWFTLHLVFIIWILVEGHHKIIGIAIEAVSNLEKNKPNQANPADEKPRR